MLALNIVFDNVGFAYLSHNRIIACHEKLNSYLLLKKFINNLEKKNLLFVNGPGSFSGLRINAIFAQNLAYAWNTKVFTTSSLALLAYKNYSKKKQKGTYTSFIDARMNQVYKGVFLFASDYFTKISECLIDSKEYLSDSKNKENKNYTTCAVETLLSNQQISDTTSIQAQDILFFFQDFPQAFTKHHPENRIKLNYIRPLRYSRISRIM